MAKCSLNGCNEKAVGGFQAIIDAGHQGDPTATLPGLRTIWCKAHQDSLAALVSWKRGKYLTLKELEMSEQI